MGERTQQVSLALSRMQLLERCSPLARPLEVLNRIIQVHKIVSGFVVVYCAESGKQSDTAVNREQPSTAVADRSARTPDFLDIKFPSHRGLLERIRGEED